MEKMDQKICLDTDIVISLLKGDQKAKVLLNKLENKEVSITSVTAFELCLRQTNLDIINRFIESMMVLPFDLAVSKKAASIYKDLKKRGKLIDIRDLFIGSTALFYNYSLLTFNKRHFQNIDGLNLFN